MRVRIILGKLQDLDRSTGLHIQFADGRFVVVAEHAPHRSVVRRQTVRPIPRYRHHVKGLKGLRVGLDDPVQPRGHDPKLPIHELYVVYTTSPEGNLVTAYSPALHVALHNFIIGAIDLDRPSSFWLAIRRHPNVAASYAHSTGVMGFSLNRMEHLAVQIDQRRTIRNLVADPDTFRRGVEGIREAVRRFEEPSHFRFPLDWSGRLGAIRAARHFGGCRLTGGYA